MSECGVCVCHSSPAPSRTSTCVSVTAVAWWLLSTAAENSPGKSAPFTPGACMHYTMTVWYLHIHTVHMYIHVHVHTSSCIACHCIIYVKGGGCEEGV